jgi:hypothetical protein
MNLFQRFVSFIIPQILLIHGWSRRVTEIMNYRAASRAVSGIATPKNYAASPAFYICYKRRMRGKLRGIYIPSPAFRPRASESGINENLRAPPWIRFFSYQIPGSRRYRTRFA